MELVTGAMGSLIRKLKDLLMEEYKLQTGVKEQVKCLADELESAHAALRKVAQVRPDQLDDVVKIWAREVREASYGMEDILDTYLVRVKGSNKHSDHDSFLKHLGEKMTGLLKKSKERHKISGAIESIRKNLQEVADRRGRFNVDNIVAKPASSSRTVDPRLTAMYREASQIIGIDKSSAALISLLSAKGNGESNQKMKIVSVVGVGGLGKTTLAKAVYDKLKSMFGYGAFVPVGQDPELKKVLRDILIDLDMEKYTHMKFTTLDERQLINELRGILQKKRYFVVIDDIWEPQSWEKIKLAFVENNCASRIIITTRKFEVGQKADEVYKLQPLSHDNSKKLLYTRLFGAEKKWPSNHPDDLSDMILKKCAGVPLAIITMGSLLLGKSSKEWYEVCNSSGFCQDKDDGHMADTMHILSLSYYDLPSHLKTCLLYLSVFPEDSLIGMDSLISKWIAEGFIEKKQGRGLFEVGEEYFYELINRSMIMGVHSDVHGRFMHGCRVHDMVLDLIVSISHEENFVSVDGTLSPSHTRRLVLKNRQFDLAGDTTHVKLPQVRSFILWRCAIDNWTQLPSLKLIRVLALEDCKFIKGRQYSLEHIGNLLHLRYLRIITGRDCEIMVPKEIGGLKFLQTLEVDVFQPLELPYSVGDLTQLVCLRASHCISLPVGVLGKLTALEALYLETEVSDESFRQLLKELGNLCEIKVLKIVILWDMNESMQKNLMQSLGSLQKMQHLTLHRQINPVYMDAWDAAVPSRDIRYLFVSDTIFPRMPSWIKSVHLPSLSHLEIDVKHLDEKDLVALGRLPKLCYLYLISRSTATITSTNTEADGCFQALRSLVLPLSTVQFVANEDSSTSFTTFKWSFDDVDTGKSRKKGNYSVGVGPTSVVMPSLEELMFHVEVEKLVQNKVVSCGELGLEYLSSIRTVKVKLECAGAFEDDVEREEAALRHAIQVHPNSPTLQIDYRNRQLTKRRSDGDDDE